MSDLVQSTGAGLFAGGSFTGAKLLAGIRADVDAFLGGERAGSRSSSSAATSPTGGPLAGMLSELGDLLKAVSAMLGDERAAGARSTARSTGGSPASAGGEVIAGQGRIWGDPHFEGQDGDRYDVQGEAGKTYNLLSDQNFQMNGRFDAYGTGGATVVGEVGISAGADQIDVSKDGSVTVNGRELREGDSVNLADGGKVTYGEGKLTVESGEWTTDISFQGEGDTAHLNIDVRTDNANADGVKPHGLLGQTFDADSDRRVGDAGSGAQGGGAIEGSNGITAAGNRSAVSLYEVDDIHDRNFESFNQFFDRSDADPEGTQDQRNALVSAAFNVAIQTMMFAQMSLQRNALAA